MKNIHKVMQKVDGLCTQPIDYRGKKKKRDINKFSQFLIKVTYRTDLWLSHRWI